MNKIIGCLLLIMTTFCSNAQNKKEQIEALNFSIDSLNAVLTTTRDNASKDISSLNDKIKEISDEITTLKTTNNMLLKENDKLKTDLGELSKKNLELESRIKATDTNTVKIGHLEVMKEDLVQDMNWDDVKKACADFGDGWRLPTKDELNMMYENADYIGGFANNGYWSSTEYDSNHAWLQVLGDGDQLYTNKYYYFHVRAVRDFFAQENGVQRIFYGILDTKTYEWKDGGQLQSEGNYIDGKRDGIHKEWQESGQLTREGNYTNGKEEGIHRGWHENGQVMMEGNYIGGKRDGIHKVWYDNGRLKYEGNWIDGKKDGVNRMWFQNGQLSREGNFINGIEQTNSQFEGQIKVTDTNSVRIGNLVVMKEDLCYMNWDIAFNDILGDQMGWDDARKTCANLGDGWRLPTKDELNMLYENKDEIGGFVNFNYWSSTEVFNDTAWNQEFEDGSQACVGKIHGYFVRAVRIF